MHTENYTCTIGTSVGNSVAYPMHAHEQHEIYHFIGGEGVYIVEGTEYPLFKDCILIMRSSEAHMPRLRDDVPYTRSCIHFYGSMLDGFDRHHDLLKPFFDRPIGIDNLYTPDSFATRRIYQSIALACETGDELRCTALIVDILCELKDAFDARIHASPELAEGTINEIIHYINNNLEKQLSLALLTEKFYMSKSQLLRKFKSATGSTVWDYVTVKRLIRARAMLRGGTSAVRTASACGFSDYSSFFKAYKKKYGSSPRDEADEKPRHD